MDGKLSIDRLRRAIYAAIGVPDIRTRVMAGRAACNFTDQAHWNQQVIKLAGCAKDTSSANAQHGALMTIAELLEHSDESLSSDSLHALQQLVPLLSAACQPVAETAAVVMNKLHYRDAEAAGLLAITTACLVLLRLLPVLCLCTDLPSRLAAIQHVCEALAPALITSTLRHNVELYPTLPIPGELLSVVAKLLGSVEQAPEEELLNVAGVLNRCIQMELPTREVAHALPESLCRAFSVATNQQFRLMLLTPLVKLAMNSTFGSAFRVETWFRCWLEFSSVAHRDSEGLLLVQALSHTAAHPFATCHFDLQEKLKVYVMVSCLLHHDSGTVCGLAARWIQQVTGTSHVQSRVVALTTLTNFAVEWINLPELLAKTLLLESFVSQCAALSIAQADGLLSADSMPVSDGDNDDEGSFTANEAFAKMELSELANYLPTEPYAFPAEIDSSALKEYEGARQRTDSALRELGLALQGSDSWAALQSRDVYGQASFYLRLGRVLGLKQVAALRASMNWCHGL
jgi:hypothetical protein